MQIDQIRISDIIKNEKVADVDHISSGVNSPKNKKEQVEGLRDIQMDSPFYSRSILESDTVADQLEKDLTRGTDANSLANQMAVYANTTSPEDLKNMQEQGYDPMNTEVQTIVTVVDRIKLELAKSGKDISTMGDLSSDKIEAMTGSAGLANKVEHQLAEFDMPVDEELSKEIATTVFKAEELSNPLSEQSAKYLMNNQLEPTIDNVYQANFAAGSIEFTPETTERFVPMEAPSEDMEEQFEAVLADLGIEDDGEKISDCQWMVENDIPVTPENISYLDDLKTINIAPGEEVLADAITEAVLDGKKPGEASLLQEKNLVTKARQVQEARMMMSVQANYALLKKGIAIDTLSIDEMIEELKDMEASLMEQVLGGEDKVEIFDSFTEKIDSLKDIPAAVLGFVQKTVDMTVAELEASAKKVATSFMEATQRYETLWTAPRKDLGDSIQKAFANVDDILEDLDLDVTEENRRAVRILSYNEMELSKENITNVKADDVEVQRLFTALKPAVVTEIIKRGYNPLDLKIGELTDLAEDMAQEMNSGSEEEKFAKFLWKLERTDGISEEERESYIGVYRLIHQVEAGDGAAIGALLAQGTDVTLRNLMTAVRSGKHTGRQYDIDDNFGEVESFDKNSLSITEQIEMAFQTKCLHEAGEDMTPVKMKEFDGEASYMDLTPEQFKDTLANMNASEMVKADEELEEEYVKQTLESVTKALSSEEQIYQILERADIPQTPAYLAGVAQMLQDRNSVYRNLLKYAATEQEDDIGIRDLIVDLLEEYGEAVKTPEEMAKAQRKLEETAENVMKKMVVESKVSSIDVRGMKLVHTQLHAIGKIAEREETYHIPIMVEDKLGNLSLKIVRGTDEKGLVDIALDTDETGVVSASFRYEAGEVSGDLSFERRNVQEIFSNHMHLLAEYMQEETGLPVSFKFAWDKNTTTADFYEEKDVGFEQTKEKDEVSSKVLYGVAKSFIDTLTEII